MRTTEEIFDLVQYGLHHNENGLTKFRVLKMIELAQKEAYNEAIHDAANSAKYTYYMFKFQNGIKYIDSETLSIDKESILDLLKP